MDASCKCRHGINISLSINKLCAAYLFTASIEFEILYCHYHDMPLAIKELQAHFSSDIYMYQ